MALPSIPLIDSILVGESSANPYTTRDKPHILVLGVGNIIMGDEGVGVHVLRHLENHPLPHQVRLLDGGTGGVNLLCEFDAAYAVILIDATRDGSLAGTIKYRKIDKVAELPRGLGAHDFGLKDLFAAAALIGKLPELHLYTIEVEEMDPMTTELSRPVELAVPKVIDMIAKHATLLANDLALK